MTGIMAASGLLFAPFRGVRYADTAKLAERLAPPYDVVSSDQRRALAKQDPQNIVHLDLPVGAPGENAYATAGDLLRSWMRRGTLVRDAEPSAYVLRTTTSLPDGTSQSRTGVFLAVAALPFAPGSRVRPHERTHEGPKEDRRKLMLETGANLSPIFLLAPDVHGSLAKNLAEVTAGKPWATAGALEGWHEIWVVDGQMALRLSMLASDSNAYIADGHHRYETAVYLREDRDLRRNWVDGARRTLAYVVSFKDPGLTILPTHRIIEGMPLERPMVLKAASKYFQRVQKGETPHFTVAFADGSEAAMRLRPKVDLSAATELPEHPSVRNLAVAIADAVFIRVVLDGLYGRPAKLRYTPSEAEARTTVQAGNDAAAIILPATRLDEVRAVSDAGEVMPPKSTFFAPKVPTGVVLRLFDGES